MATFPKLTDTQERAWKIIYNRAKDSSGYFDTWHIEQRHLTAFVEMGMLILNGCGELSEYRIHPDYLPTVTPATSEPEPAPVAPETSEPTFKVGDRVVVVNKEDYHAGETGEIIGIDEEYYSIEFLRGGSWNAMWYVVEEFEPADGTPATGERAADPRDARIAELETAPFDKPLRVWWVSNPPRKPHYVPVNTPDEAIKVLEILGDYDIWIGDDVITENAGGLEVFENNEWTEWYSDEGDDIDDYRDSLED